MSNSLTAFSFEQGNSGGPQFQRSFWELFAQKLGLSQTGFIYFGFFFLSSSIFASVRKLTVVHEASYRKHSGVLVSTCSHPIRAARVQTLILEVVFSGANSFVSFVVFVQNKELCARKPENIVNLNHT